MSSASPPPRPPAPIPATAATRFARLRVALWSALERLGVARLVGRMSRRARWSLGIAAGLALAAALAFGPIVRARASAEAAKRGLVLDVGAVRAGWFAVTLRGVQARLEGVDGVTAGASAVRIDLDAFGRPTAITVEGGRVDARGDLGALIDAIDAWRKRRPPSPGGSEARHHTTLRLEGGELSWQGEGGDALAVTGAELTRDDDGARAQVISVHGASRGFTVDARDASLTLAAEGKLHELRAASIDLGYATTTDELGSAAATSSSEPAPPPLPVPLPKKHGARVVTSAEAPLFDAGDPLLPLPHLKKLRGRLATATSLLAARLGNDGVIAVDRLTLNYDRGAGTPRLTLGPGELAASRHDSAIDVEFKSDASAAKADAKNALSLRTSLPVEHGDVRVHLEGGPVALALLGVHEGGGGLTDVDRASLAGKGDVVLSDGADALTFDVDLGVRGLGIHLPRLSPEVVHGLDLAVRARGVLTEPGADAPHPLGELRLDDAEVALGSLHVRGHGRLAQEADHAEGTLAFDVPAAACQALFESIPSALVPELVGAEMEGTFRGKGRLAFDSRKLDDLALEYDIDDLCKLTAVPEALSKERFEKTFTHRVYHPDGSTYEIETGPGTDAWSALERISPYMEVAVLTTEDGAFFHHRGFNHAAIKSSLIANLKAKKFVRGASTISMQTAKNLFLFRDKTLARKLEEVILTDYLEQNFSKEEIMELYLNVIEFGPDLYGITAAADHYFGRKPDELNLAECLFLSSLLPRPVGDHYLYEKGALPESWVKNLHALMEIARKTEKISDAELKEALGETISFHKEGDPPPPPRAPITGVHFTGDDVGWQPVE